MRPKQKTLHSENLNPNPSSLSHPHFPEPLLALTFKNPKAETLTPSLKS